MNRPIPGDRVLWGQRRAQVVNPEDAKLGAGVDRRTDEDLVLVVADNGQLVWVREEDLRVELPEAVPVLPELYARTKEWIDARDTMNAARANRNAEEYVKTNGRYHTASGRLLAYNWDDEKGDAG